MNTPPSPSGAEHTDGSSVGLGALVPLTRPGWVEAGRHLLAGLELAAREVNDAGGIDGRPLELVVRDTAADPERPRRPWRNWPAWAWPLWRASTTASSPAQPPPAPTPSACRSSARPRCSTRSPRSRRSGSRAWPRPSPTAGRSTRTSSSARAGCRIAVATQPSVYWASGTRVLRDHLVARGGTVVELDTTALTPEALCDVLVGHGATALLLLVGHPEPAVPIVRAVRGDRRLAEILIGAPAGQPEFAEWAVLLGEDGAGIPFLRYLPERLGPLGQRVGNELRERLGEAPSFVAFEGWDTVAVLAEVLRSHGTDRAAIAASWPRVVVEGTRGPVRFSRTPGISVWQWAWTPIQVVDRDPAEPDRFRILHVG